MGISGHVMSLKHFSSSLFFQTYVILFILLELLTAGFYVDYLSPNVYL